MINLIIVINNIKYSIGTLNSRLRKSNINIPIWLTFFYVLTK